VIAWVAEGFDAASGSEWFWSASKAGASCAAACRCAVRRRQFGSATPAPVTNLNLGNNEQADAATAFDDNGTGKTG
jgi:hypothetical protein